jgi:hypothetical protein
VARYHLAVLEYPARTELLRMMVYAFGFCRAQQSKSAGVHTDSGVNLDRPGIVVSLIGIGQFFAHRPIVRSYFRSLEPMYRATGTFLYANALAAFLEMILPLALACILLCRFSHVLKVVLGYVALVMAVGR